MSWRDTTIKHEDIDELFPAKVAPHHRFSGRVLPRFDLYTARRVVDALNTAPFSLVPDGGFRLTWEGANIRHYELNLAWSQPDYRGKIIEPDSDGLYTIGGNWCCWVEVTTNDQ
ncbi:hypothetical protein [Nonomuraea sp. SYSU D8015]|uniref:hypothetical protein n=1 Tax=Nonomuraea sp. SYSU D8015 TaxID=2593644 RepID=UPI00166054B6|nr:hypothetical protein [Nonomuraea sp. SYSU D8015]